MNTRVHILVLVSLFFGASLASAEVLHGIPGGTFSDPCFANGYPEEYFSGQGHWTYYRSTNASATIAGTDQDRHVELWTEWFVRGAGFWYTDEASTPLDSPWRISADLKADIHSSSAHKYFVLTHDTTQNVWDFVLDFYGDADQNGKFPIQWTAGSNTGTYYASTSIVGNYATAYIEYNPVTGVVSGGIGNEIVFSETVATGIPIRLIYFGKIQYTYGDQGIFYVDNVHAGSIPTIPVAQLWEPGLSQGEVYTGSTGLNVVKIGWSEPVSFTSSNITVTNSAGSSVPFTVSGSGSAMMTINLSQILFKNKYTLTILDTVKSTSAGVTIDGNEDGVAGGNKVLVVEHRMRPDTNGDNAVNFTDFANFATDWLWQK